jgi:hypothetical protein
VFDALKHTLQKMSDRDRYCCLLFVWNVNQRECPFQSEVWLYWGFWGLWNKEDSQTCKSCFSFHGPWCTSKVEATYCLLLGPRRHTS